MPTATKTAKPTAATQRAVVRALSQQVAGELIGKPPVWLRDNAHRACRNADSTYDGPALVAGMLADPPIAELADAELERVIQVVESVQPPGDRFDHALATIERINDQFGTPGLAAVGAELLRFLREWCDLDTDTPSTLPPEEEFVADAVSRAESDAREAHRVLSGRSKNNGLWLCDDCGKYRFGRTWKAGPLPPGYVPLESAALCPKCSAAPHPKR